MATTTRRVKSAVLVCALMLAGACGGKEKPPAEWERFTFSDDGFSVRAPLHPRVSNSTIDTDLGASETRTYVCSKLSDRGALIVMINDIVLPAGTDMATALHGGVQGNASTFGGQVVSEVPVAKNGIQGTSYKIRGNDADLGPIEVVGESFHDGGHMFQAIALIPLDDEKYREKGEAFIASFEPSSAGATRDERE